MLSVDAEVGPGRTELRLPRRLGVGIYSSRLTARDAHGRGASDRLQVLGRPRMNFHLARRFIETGFADNYEGAGEYFLRFARCAHHGPRVVRCRVIDGTLGRRSVRNWWIASAAIRRDGVVVYRFRYGRSDKPSSSVVEFE